MTSPDWNALNDALAALTDVTAGFRARLIAAGFSEWASEAIVTSWFEAEQQIRTNRAEGKAK